jgi:hypothetical protein
VLGGGKFGTGPDEEDIVVERHAGFVLGFDADYI